MDPRKTADQGFLREMNLSAVLRFIYSEAPLSRSKLAAKTGLNKSTISILVEDLLDRRLIHETGVNSAGTGRPATLLEIKPGAGAVIAIDMGVDYVGAALIDFCGSILWRRQIATDPSSLQEVTLGQMRELVNETIRICGERELRNLGLSFSIPGTVDIDEGVLIFAPNLNWHNVPFRNLFSASTGLKVFIENDANAAAVAEHLFGVARQARDFIFVFAGVGLGGGLFLNDKLYRGKGGYAGEIGHTPIMAEPFQMPCHCGNLGCWETYANQNSIVRRVQSRLDSATGSAGLIPGMMMEQSAPLSFPMIKAAADGGDRFAIDSLAEAGTAMGTGLAGLVNIFNPEKIVLGGPISVAGDYLLPSIRASVQKHAMGEIIGQTEISISAFGSDASLIGAAAVVVNNILAHPTNVEKEVMPRTVFDSIAA